MRVSDQLFRFKKSIGDSGTDKIPKQKTKSAIVKAGYLAAIGIAMIGWLCFIAWCAWELI
jgi:hypothetical protein